jgi:transcriptional regulator with XRE-family HTH domain
MLEGMTEDAGRDRLELMTASELARALGVAPSTVSNWTKRERNPLKTVLAADGTKLYTWTQLEEFRRSNPGLRGANRSVHPGRQERALPSQAADRPQVDELKSIARDLRNATNASVQAALEAARLAEETARSHRVQLEHFAQLMAAYDAALSNITASSSIND